jgi:pyrophosphatase PpaX
MGNINTVIFDIDGTLADTEELYLASYAYAFEKLTGKKYTPNEIMKLRSTTEKQVLEEILSVNQMKVCASVFYQFYEQNHDKLTKFYPQIKEVLFSLENSGFKLGIFTGKSYLTACLSLKKLELNNLCNLLVTEKDYLNPKPHPEGLILTLKKLDAKPENSIYIGDAWTDFLVAKSAGLFFGAALWGTQERNKLIKAKPDFSFETPEEILVKLK